MTEPQVEASSGVLTMADDSAPAPEETPRQRVRITYEKGEAIKFISHQDEFRMWERTLRRADLPLLYKQGFNPQPHMQFASPLGVGFGGVRELLDITFSPPLELDELRSRIESKLAPGVALHAIHEVPLKTEALQSLLIGADYTILIYAEPGEIPDGLIEARIDAFLARGEILRERQRKGNAYTYNLRPLVLELDYLGYHEAREEHHIFLRVQQRSGATGRPDEVVDALDFDDFARTLRRERLYLSSDPNDVATFAGYPIVEKADVEVRSSGGGRRGQKRRGQKQRAKTTPSAGRTIGERAADEFD